MYRKPMCHTPSAKQQRQLYQPQNKGFQDSPFTPNPWVVFHLPYTLSCIYTLDTDLEKDSEPF